MYLPDDPIFRLIGSEKIRDRGGTASRLHWFETKVLMQAANIKGLAAMNRWRKRIPIGRNTRSVFLHAQPNQP
jgi:hypothetical protein